MNTGIPTSLAGYYGTTSNPAKIISFNTIEANNTIGPNAHVTYKAADKVILKPGFKTVNGAYFLATTEPVNCTHGGSPLYYRTANSSDSLLIRLDTLGSISTSVVSIHKANNTNSNVDYTELVTTKKDEVLKLKQKLRASFFIYPNPNNGEFVLELSHLPKGNYTLQITDAIGRSVIQQNYSVQEQNLKQNINLQAQDKGIYFVKINSEQINEVRKIVVD